MRTLERALIALILLLLLCGCGNRVRFAAPPAQLPPGVAITIRDAFVKKERFYVVAKVTNVSGQPIYLNPGAWALRVPHGPTLLQKDPEDDVEELEHGETEKLKVVFVLEGVPIKHVSGLELIVAGLSHQPGGLSGPVSAIHLFRPHRVDD